MALESQRKHSLSGDDQQREKVYLSQRGLPATATNACKRVFKVNKNLTPHQTKICRLVAYGRTNKEIAEHLGTTHWTVSRCIGRVLKKTGFRNRVELAVWFAFMEDARTWER